MGFGIIENIPFLLQTIPLYMTGGKKKKKKKSSQEDRIFVYETCPNFVYEQYIRDGFQFGTHRECPTTGYVKM